LLLFYVSLNSSPVPPNWWKEAGEGLAAVGSCHTQMETIPSDRKNRNRRQARPPMRISSIYRNQI